MLPHLPSPSRFPVPDWAALWAHAEAQGLGGHELNKFWNERGRDWVHLLRQALGPDYRGYESKNFWLISSQPEKACRQLIAWAEHTLAKVDAHLGAAASGPDEAFGKIPMLVMHDLDTYYEYVAAYLSDGEHALSSGVYINRGYGHFLFAFLHMNEAESVLAHELTHSLLSHLPIPSWLNEGVAQLCEIAITGRDPTRWDDFKDTLGTFWTAESIQDLWTGRGFNRQDEGQLHSYHLAQVLTRKLSGNAKRFQAFLREANAADAGAAAVQKHYGVTLAQLVTEYLGEGDWAPVSEGFTINDENRL